ncbi:hypothetical protein C8R46DRAFT_348678 [Mycena filopes]|nr:hypothetical protein C8R46DRAFT_348678 [Mycena filopes]
MQAVTGLSVRPCARVGIFSFVLCPGLCNLLNVCEDVPWEDANNHDALADVRASNIIRRSYSTILVGESRLTRTACKLSASCKDPAESAPLTCGFKK